MTKRLFISYAWENDAYRLWVRRLAARFRQDGVDAHIDQWHLKPNDNLAEFMSREVRWAEWVLVLCSPAYQSKLRATEDGDRTSGVGWEMRLLTGRMLAGSESKILAALARGSWADAAPDFLAGQVYYDLSAERTFGRSYRELLQRITGTYETAPPLGRLPADLEPEPVEPLRDTPDEPASAGATTASRSPRREPAAPSMLVQRVPLPYKLIYTRITADGVLDWESSPIAPYDDWFDPTGAAGGKPRITVVLYFPDAEYIKTSPLKRFTAITAICCLDPDLVAADALRIARAEGLDLGRPANRTHPADRERLFAAMPAALGGTFVVTVAVPAPLLRAGRKRPEIAYQALCSTFLVPLVELHKRLELQEVHLRLVGVGGATDKLTALVRSALREEYPKRSGSSVEVINGGAGLAVVGQLARYLRAPFVRVHENSTLSSVGGEEVKFCGGTISELPADACIGSQASSDGALAPRSPRSARLNGWGEVATLRAASGGRVWASGPCGTRTGRRSAQTQPAPTVSDSSWWVPSPVSYWSASGSIGITAVGRGAR